MLHVLVLSLILSVGACSKAIPNVQNQNDFTNKDALIGITQNPNSLNTEIASQNEAPEDHVSVAYLNPGNFSGYWKLIGNCSNENTLVKIEYESDENVSGYTHVPCVDGLWLYNEMFGIEINTILVTHGEASAEMNMSRPTPWAGARIDCNPNDPYTWRHEMTSAFGQNECHAVAYCSSGRPYIYSDSVSTQCTY